jgi:AraC-like DNA-binding protein
MPTCHRHYPGRSDEACPLVYLHRLRPSLCNSQVGSCNCFFGACSAFTHVMACMLAESPCDPLHRRLRQLRCLRCRFDCYRVERTSSRAGVAPAEVQRLFTAHCHNNHHVDLGSFRVDDVFVFTMVYALLRSVALRSAESCGLISAANAGVGEPLLASQRTRGKACHERKKSRLSRRI